jgi:hypothetical protein
MATALRWTPDGRELAFAWNGAAIRLLDLERAAPSSAQGDLIRSSSLLAGIGTGETTAGTSLTCVAAHGWALSTGARTFTCAGSVTPARPVAGPGCGKDTPAHPAFVQVISLGRGAQRLTTLARSSSCVASGPRTVGAELGWISPDGSRVMGTLGVSPPELHVRFGIFTAKTFSALPVFLPDALVADVAW